MNEAKAINVKSLPVVKGKIGVVLTQADYDSNLSKMENGIQVARFDHSAPVPLYRIINEEEYSVHIPKAGGKITGGDFQPGAEKAFGASFGFDPKLLLKNFAGKGTRKHLSKGGVGNYLVYVPDANGMMFANMELTHQKNLALRPSFGLNVASTNSPYKGVSDNRLKNKIKLPYKFTIPDDLCHPTLGCQMVLDIKKAKAKIYKIGPRGTLTEMP